MFEKNREILETITLHVDNIVIQLQSSDIFWVYILCEDNSHGAIKDKMELRRVQIFP